MAEKKKGQAINLNFHNHGGEAGYTVEMINHLTEKAEKVGNVQKSKFVWSFIDTTTKTLIPENPRYSKRIVKYRDFKVGKVWNFIGTSLFVKSHMRSRIWRTKLFDFQN